MLLPHCHRHRRSHRRFHSLTARIPTPRKNLPIQSVHPFLYCLTLPMPTPSAFKSKATRRAGVTSWLHASPINPSRTTREFTYRDKKVSRQNEMYLSEDMEHGMQWQGGKWQIRILIVVFLTTHGRNGFFLNEAKRRINDVKKALHFLNQKHLLQLKIPYACTFQPASLIAVMVYGKIKINLSVFLNL